MPCLRTPPHACSLYTGPQNWNLVVSSTELKQLISHSKLIKTWDYLFLIKIQGFIHLSQSHGNSKPSEEQAHKAKLPDSSKLMMILLMMISLMNLKWKDLDFRQFPKAALVNHKAKTSTQIISKWTELQRQVTFQGHYQDRSVVSSPRGRKA